MRRIFVASFIPLCTALGALLIEERLELTDRETVEAIALATLSQIEAETETVEMSRYDDNHGVDKNWGSSEET